MVRALPCFRIGVATRRTSPAANLCTREQHMQRMGPSEERWYRTGHGFDVNALVYFGRAVGVFLFSMYFICAAL